MIDVKIPHAYFSIDVNNLSMCQLGLQLREMRFHMLTRGGRRKWAFLLFGRTFNVVVTMGFLND